MVESLVLFRGNNVTQTPKTSGRIIAAIICLKSYLDSLYFYEKVLQQCLTCPKIPRILTWFNVVPSLEKLSQPVVTRNEQANFQPTLNKVAVGSVIRIFVIDCSNQLQVLDS